MDFADDIDEYEDDVPAPQELPVACLASSSAPHFGLQLAKGREPFISLLDVPSEMSWAMRSILEKPMRIHYQGTARYKTPNKRQMEQLVAACFDEGQWKTGQYHGLPSPKDVEAGVDNVYVVADTLLNDMGAVSRERANNMPARKEITHRVINRGETTKVTKRAPEKQEVSPHREVGSRVLIGIVKGAHKSFSFKYYDGAHRPLPNAFRLKNLVCDLGSIKDTKLAAMRAYEKYWMERGLRYNMEAARYIARNRLTFYANGGQHNKAPQGGDELMKYFFPYKLICNMGGGMRQIGLWDYHNAREKSSLK